MRKVRIFSTFTYASSVSGYGVHHRFESGDARDGADLQFREQQRPDEHDIDKQQHCLQCECNEYLEYDEYERE